MAITLAEASKNVQDDLQMGVIDEFRKSNWLLEHLTFDDAVSPTGGGATLTYSYVRLKTQPTASFREVNTEYTPGEVSKEPFHTTLKVFGGSYEIDRIIANMGGIVSEIELQQSQKIKAAQALFNDTFINGDSATNASAFDGLDKALTGTDTEFAPTVIDLSNAQKISDNYIQFLHLLNKFLKKLDGKPSFIGGNADMISAIQLCAQLAGRYQITSNEFGQQVESYNGIPLVDLGNKPGSNNEVVKTDSTTGISSLYFGRLGLDGLHAVSMAGQPPIQTWLPDYKTSGAVKKGEVEMVAALALKASKAAGKFTNIKVL